MLGIEHLGLFVISGLLLNMTPGADTLYIVSQSAARGRRAGVFAALGIGAGCIVHILAAALGLSALMMASSQAFFVVKIIGAAYLVYLGFSMFKSSLRSAPESAPVTAVESIAVSPKRASEVFWQGFLTNVLNPKVALFFLAFLPHFIAVDAPNRVLSMLLLGVIFDVNGTLWNILIAVLSAGMVQRFPALTRFAQWFKRGVGVLFVFLGGQLALSE
ncbi:MAG: LysE family translocator [Burkholderiaceae bacterium]